jgi:putative transposase
MLTDKLKSCSAANKVLGLNVEQCQHKGLNNRCENSHEPKTVRENVMRRFKSARQLQQFLSVHDQVANVFKHCRYNRDAKAKRPARAQAMQTWEAVSCARWMKNDVVRFAARPLKRLIAHNSQQVDNTAVVLAG